jgi:MFS transporter, FHS family, L-fucose permease
MKNKYLLPFILLTSLFFLWGFALNLNPILIPHLKKACQLTDFQSALIYCLFFGSSTSGFIHEKIWL